HDETPSIYKEFLDLSGGGFNQVAYWVDDVADVRDRAVAAGWTEVWSGNAGGLVDFSYLVHPDSPVPIVELTVLNDATRPLNDMLRDAAEAWAPGQPTLVN